MTTTADATPQFTELLNQSPKNWGKWGPEDEIGCLNYLGEQEALNARAEIRSGKSFTLGIPIADPAGDPVWPGRRTTQRFNVIDHSHFSTGKGPDIPGGAEYADDVVVMYLQGTTQFDALGHAWHGDEIYNGYPADSTVGATEKASILPIAEHGVVGRGVLIDIAAHRGRKVLAPGETFGLEDLLAAAEEQKVEIRKRDILLIRTGWIGSYYDGDVEKFHAEPFLEPGLCYSPELVQWFADMEIPVLGTDTIANEVTIDPNNHTSLPLHQALMRNLGVLFSEILALDALAEDCRGDGQWSFMYSAAPLKIHSGTGAPVNPVVIK